MSEVCFLDLDGVLVNFVSGAFNVHGRSIPMADVLWDFPAQIGFSGGNDPAFWDVMGHDFWANLDWTPEGPGLLAAAERVYGESVVLLTSPCATPGGVEGKVAWIRKHLPNYTRRFFVGPPKHFIAGPGKLLVDDHDGNIEGWAAHGGETVTVPRPWNARHGDTNQHGHFDVERLAKEIEDKRYGTYGK